MSKLVSVIVPVYNRQDMLEEAVQSVLAQSYRNFEILLIDGGSTDGTASLCQELVEKDSRIRFFATEHVGVSATRNIGLKQAAGEYIFFLDSDDVIYPLLLETLVTAMEESKALIGGTDVAHATAQNWHKVQKKINEVPTPGETTLHSGEETLSALFLGGSPLSCIGGVMMHRDLIGNTTFRTDLYIGEDFFFIYENVIKGAPGVFLKQKWYYVRNHEHNSSWDYSFSGFWTRFYRRKLVWESEAAFGRTDYVNMQKRDAVGCFLMCVEKNKPYSADSKKMRKIMSEYRSVLFPALGSRAKIYFCTSLYIPFMYPVFRWIHKNLKKLGK